MNFVTVLNYMNKWQVDYIFDYVLYFLSITICFPGLDEEPALLAGKNPIFEMAS